MCPSHTCIAAVTGHCVMTTRHHITGLGGGGGLTMRGSSLHLAQAEHKGSLLPLIVVDLRLCVGAQVGPPAGHWLRGCVEAGPRGGQPGRRLEMSRVWIGLVPIALLVPPVCVIKKNKGGGERGRGSPNPAKGAAGAALKGQLFLRSHILRSAAQPSYRVAQAALSGCRAPQQIATFTPANARCGTLIPQFL